MQAVSLKASDLQSDPSGLSVRKDGLNTLENKNKY